MTEPLVAAHVDLRDFPFMPLDVVRLRDSDLAAIATGDGFRAAVILWCAAWHQIPAASLPTDDRMLARLAGYGRDLDGWMVVKFDALRSFIECDDGRLYHPVIAEKARDAWEAKAAQRARTAAALAARLAKQEADRLAKEGGAGSPSRDNRRNVKRDVQRDEQRDVHQGTGTGTGTNKTTQPARGDRLSQIDADSLEAKLLQAVADGDGSCNHASCPALLDLSPIRGLIDAGYDLDAEILPVVRARSSGLDLRSWSYFVEAVHESRVKRLSAGAPRSAINGARAGPAPRSAAARPLPRDPVLQAREELLRERETADHERL